jgi:GTP-binding protein
MEIREVSFRCAALRAHQRPPEWFPQVAVAGRSNVGKSSLLNWLFRQNVAKVAKAPGKTRALNFFLVNRNFYLVDLPGYGYAKVGQALRDEWGRELGRYLGEERRLAGVVALVDVRHGLTRLDRDLQEVLLATQSERLVVLTKGDKVNRSHRQRMQQGVQHELALPLPPLTVSVQTGDGRKELLARIDALVTAWRDRNTGEIDGTQEKIQQ